MSDIDSMKPLASRLFAEAEERIQRALEAAQGQVDVIVREHDDLKAFEQRVIEFITTLAEDYDEDSALPASAIRMVSHIYSVVMNDADPDESAEEHHIARAPIDAGPAAEPNRITSAISRELERQHQNAAGGTPDFGAVADALVLACADEGIVHLVLPAPEAAGLDAPWWDTDAGEVSVAGDGTIRAALEDIKVGDGLAVAAAIAAASRHPKAA